MVLFPPVKATTVRLNVRTPEESFDPKATVIVSESIADFVTCLRWASTVCMLASSASSEGLQAADDVRRNAELLISTSMKEICSTAGRTPSRR